MNEFTIAITTFSKRYDLLSSLVQQIRNYTDTKIILVVNGELNGEFHEDYRIKILNLCINYKNIYPILFVETRGLSKMWNTAIIHSDTDNILILNDDLKIESNEIFSKTVNIIRNDNYTGLLKINNSFSHFIVNKIVIHKIGYFDERLLGFGEEDGDISYRFEKENIKIGNVYVNGIINIISDIRHDYIKTEIGKYSKFNRNFIYNEKYKKNENSPFRGMFDTSMDEILVNQPQYVYEKFFRKNKNKL